MWPQKKPFDPLAFLRVGNVVQPARGANTVQPQNQAPKPQQKPQLPSQFSALNRPTVQNQVQRTVNPNQQPQQQPVTAPFRQPAPQRIIAPAPVRSAMPQNTIKPALSVNQQVNQMTQPLKIGVPQKAVIRPQLGRRQTTPLPIPNRNILQQAGSLVNRGRDIITPGDQSFTWKAPEEIINEKLAQDKLKNDTFQAITQSDIYKRNQPQIKEALNKGKSFEEISDQTGLGVGDIRAVVDVTRPNYGVKKTNFIGQIVDGGKAFGKGIYDAATVIPKTVTNTAATMTDSHKQALASLEGAYKRGEITSTRYQEQLQNLMDGVIGRKVVSDDNGVRVENQNPFEFGLDFTNDGIDTASVVSPYAKGASVSLNGAKLVTPASKGVLPQLTTTGKQLLKEAHAWNAISNAQSALNGQLSPETILQNAAMNYGMPLAGYGVTKGGQRVKTTIDQAAQAPHIRTLQSPEIQQINAHGEQLFAQKQALIDRGLSPTSPAVKQMDNAIRKLGKEYNKTYKRVYEQTKQEMLEPLIKANEFTRNHLIPGGTLGGPLAAGYRDAKKQGLVFDGLDGKPRFEVDDSGAKIKNPNGNTLGDVLDHPELYKNYPELKSTRVSHIEGKDSSFGGSEIRLGKQATDKRGSLLHETQHAIQDKEKFASGGGPEAKDFNLNDYTNTPAGKAHLAENVRLAKDKDPSLTDIQAKNLAGHKTRQEASYSQYRNLAGEAEARAVQARMNMPMSERYVKDSTPIYHGTTKQFDKFDPDQAGGSIWFTDDKKGIKDTGLAYNGREKLRVMERELPKDTKLADENLNDRYGSDELINQGYVGVKYDNGDGTHYYELFDPEKVLQKNPKVKSTFYDSLDVPKEDLIIRNGDGVAFNVDTPEGNSALAAFNQLKSGRSQRVTLAKLKESGATKVAQALRHNDFNPEARLTAIKQNIDHLRNSGHLTGTGKGGITDTNPLTDNDIKALPEVFGNPDTVYLSKQSGRNKEPRLVFEKQLDNQHKLVAEMIYDGDKFTMQTYFNVNEKPPVGGNSMSYSLERSDATADAGGQTTRPKRASSNPDKGFTKNIAQNAPDVNGKAMSIEPKNLDSMRQQVRDLWAAGKRDEAKKLSDEITTLMDVEYKKNYPKRGKDEAFLKSVGENGYPEKVNIGELRQQKNGVYAEDRYPNEVYQQLPNFIAKNDIPGTSIKSGDKVGLAGKEDGLLEAVLMPGKEYQQDGFTVSREPNMSIKDFRRITDGSKPTLQTALAGKGMSIEDPTAANGGKQLNNHGVRPHDNASPSQPVKIPRHIEEYAAESTPQSIIDETVDYWYKHGKDTKGGQLIDTTGVNDAYGSGMKRISEHNQFYSDFYKEFKRAPTKKDYVDEIERQLQSGGGSMVEPDMATAYQLAKTRQAEIDASLANAQDTTDYSMVFDAQKDVGLSVKQSNTPVQAQSKSGQKLRNSQETLSRSSQQSGQKTPSPDSKARTGQTYTDNTPQAPYSKESLNRIQRALNPNDKLAYKNLTPVEKRLYQGEKAKQRVAKLEAKEQARLEKQAKVQQRQDTIDNAPEIDTKSYVKSMSKLQKESMKGDNGVRAKAADFKEKFIDDLAPIEDRLNKAIKNGTSIDPKDHITYQLDRSRRSEGITHAYIRDNGLDKIIQNVDNTNEFDQYLIARHAKELDPEITTGRNLAKDAALVRQLDGKYGEAAKQLYAYNQKLLDTSVDYGLISKEMATKLKKQYPEYVPFNRIFNEDELANLYGGTGRGNASISKQSAVQKIKGSKRAIASPLNSIIDKTRVVIEQGERNKAAEMLAGYRKLDGNPFNLKEIPSTETIGSRSTISFLDKGKKRVFETDKEIADAAKNMTRQDIGLWGRIAAIPARVLRGGATSANVGFAGANVVKDIIGAAINSRHPFYITDPDAFGKALAAALNHKGKYYQELMREGVAGTSFDMYRNPNKSSVGEVRSHKNLATRTAYNVTHPSQWYRSFEDTIGRSEDFGRALQYYSNKKGFEDKLGSGNKNATILAADQARNNSTNFFRHGSYGKGINLAIPYWNAGVQGARIGVNRIKERPVQTLAKIGFVVAAPSAMIAMNNYGNEKNRQVIEDIPQYEKDGNIIIVGPDARKNEQTGKWEGVIKIPVPPQHIGIHKTIQDAVRASVTGEAFDVLGNLGRITEDYTTVNPTDVKAVASKYTPQGLKLVAEPLSNTNFFTGNKIVPDSQKNLPAADQYNDYTSGTAKTLGKITNISPRQIDNAIRTGMGGAGQNLVYGVDNALAATGVIDKKDVKGENPINSITRRFSGAASISPSEKADKEFAKYRQEVMNSDEYKNASQYDKSRMLNRLQSDLEAVAYDKSGKSESKLSSKQQSLKDNGFDKSIYTNLDSKVKNTKDTGWTDEYNAAKSAYDKESSSWNPVEKEKKTKELRTLDVKRHYSKEATSLYDMNEKDIYGFLDRQDEKKAQSYYKQIVEYGDKMVEAGLWSTNKLRDKNGNIQYERGYVAKNGTTRKSSGGRKASLGRKSTGRKSSGGSGGTSNASFAAILAAQKKTNDLANDTYGSLSKLLGGLAPKSQKRTIGQRAVTKKITVKGAKA